jgi:hypothetical protein
MTDVSRQVSVEHQAVGNIAQPDDKITKRSHNRGAPFLMDGDFLKVTNRHPADTYVFEWAQKVYVVAPAESKFVMFEALVDKLGDPRSMEGSYQRYNDGNGNKGVVMERSFEMERLFSRYAVLGSHLEDTVDKDGKKVLGLLSKTPHVEVETLNGERVIFPATRPDMLPFPLPNVDERNIRTDTTQALDKLEAENADMRESLNELNDKLDAMVRQREGVDD